MRQVKILVLSLAVTMALGLALAPAAMAGGDGLEGEIAALRTRLDDLEGQLDAQKTADAKLGRRLESLKAAEGLVEVPALLKGVEVSGYVDTSYTYSLADQNNRINRVRTFDTDANDFSLNLLKAVIEKPVNEEDPFGFRADLGFGEDAALFDSTGIGGAGAATGIIADDSSNNELSIEQAYVEYLAPIGSGLSIKAGKFVTLLGAEVIESIDNPNYSRSFLFGFAIPFTHVGVLTSYNVTEWMDAQLGLVNGWDQYDDVNKSKTFLSRVGVDLATLAETAGIRDLAGIDPNRVLGDLSIAWVTGPEQAATAAITAGDNENDRSVIDVIYQVQPLDKLTLTGNWDYGQENDAAVSGGVDADASWNGFAIVADYQCTDKLSAAIRYEWFKDNQGVRTGAVQDLEEITVTLNYWMDEKTLARLEFRHDESSANFTTGDLADDSQDTVTGAVAYLF